MRHIRRDSRLTGVGLLQTSILSEGFRSLAEGESVEFVVNVDNTGRSSAKEVTGPNGAQTVVSLPFHCSSQSVSAAQLPCALPPQSRESHCKYVFCNLLCQNRS